MANNCVRIGFYLKKLCLRLEHIFDRSFLYRLKKNRRILMLVVDFVDIESLAEEKAKEK